MYRDTLFELFVPIQHNIDLSGGGFLARGLDHDEPLAIGGDIIIRIAAAAPLRLGSLVNVPITARSQVCRDFVVCEFGADHGVEEI